MPDERDPPPSEIRQLVTRGKKLGGGLKHLYDDVLAQPTPSDLSYLLEKTDRRQVISQKS
jgi:Anti-sigma factor NepR